jgi:hypothetical protein
MVVPLNYSKEPVLLMLLEMRHITFWLLLLLLLLRAGTRL